VTNYLDSVRRLCSVLFIVAVTLVSLGIHTPESPATNHPAIYLLLGAGVATAIFVYRFPWGRYHPNWFLMIGVLAVGLLALLIGWTGGQESPFRPLSFFIIVASGAYYFTVAPLLFITALVSLGSLSIYLYEPITVSGLLRSAIEIPIYFVTGLLLNFLFAGQIRRLYETAQAQAADFRLLVEMGRDMVSARGLDVVLRLALERATVFTGHESGRVLLTSGPGGQLEVRASIGPEAADDGNRMDRHTEIVAAQALEERRALLLEGDAEAVGTGSRSDTAPLRSEICLPLVTPGGDTVGVLDLGSISRAQNLSAHDLDALQLLAAQLAAAIESAELHDKLRDLVGRLLVAHEDERRHVAYDVHDGLAQVAASAHQHLQAFARAHRPRSPEARAELDRVLELAQLSVQEARRVIADLRPTALDDFGLAAVIRVEVEKLQAKGWQITYDAAVGNHRLPPEVETALFRVAQEALRNVQEHAGTARVHIALKRDGTTVRLEVQDWGRGFLPRRVLRRGGPGERVGITGMQERMALLGGSCTVHSQPGAGTHVVAEIPLSGEGPGPIGETGPSSKAMADNQRSNGSPPSPVEGRS